MTMSEPITDPGLLDLLEAEGQLCAVCEERLWTQRAQWCSALICAACAEGEPQPEDEA
jgi:hypothetical protein